MKHRNCRGEMIPLRIDKGFNLGGCTIRNVNGGVFCKDDDFCSYGERKDEE